MPKPGRHRTTVKYEDFVRDPTEIMLLLANIKNDGGHSWRTLAEELRNEVSAALVRQVCLGYCNSKKVERALGMTKKHYRRCAYLGSGESGKQRAEAWDELSAEWGGLTSIVNAILDGELQII